MADTAWWGRVLAGDPSAVRHGRHAGEHYLALPSASDPRVVVDRSSRPAIADALRRYGGTRGASSLFRTASPALARLAALAAPTWSVEDSPATPSLRSHLSEALGEPVRLSVGVGPPRVNRKPVIRCYSDARLVAVAKLGPDSHTSAMISNEIRWLEQFTERPLASVCTPRLLHAGAFAGQALLVMDVLDLATEPPFPLERMPEDGRVEFRERVDQGVGLASSPWWQRLRQNASDADDVDLDVAIRQIEDSRFAPEVRWSSWHGDWSPWNVGVDRSGRTCVWDWERAEVGVPPELDLVHLEYQYGGGLDAAHERLLSEGHDGEGARLLITAYICELMCRHHAAGLVASDTYRVDRLALRTLLGTDDAGVPR